jgi:hypothetical protein
MKATKIITLSVLLPLTIASCTSNQEEQRGIVSEWMGKEILFPSDMQFQIQTNYINYNFSHADYKIVTYIDSTSCIPCQMKLEPWKNLVAEFKSIPDIDFNFVMILQGTDAKSIENNLTEYNFLNPICIDRNKSFINANKLPKSKKYDTFLLDADNKVIAIGNPIASPKIKELYKKIILKDLELDSLNRNVLCTNAVRNLGLINNTDTVSLSFDLYNHGEKPYTVQDIVPSCDCVSASIENDIIPHGKSSVRVKFAPGAKSGSFCLHVNIFLTEKETPECITIFGITK